MSASRRSGFHVDGPLPVYEGSGLDSPRHADLTGEEWTRVEGGYGHDLNADVREGIDSALLWCAWAKHRAEQGIRRSELKSRVRKLQAGLRSALQAIDYPAFKTLGDHDSIVAD